MRKKTFVGFTLIELMVAVAIIAILAAIAFPSYRDYVMRTRRTDGKGFLLVTQQNVERAYTDTNSYKIAVASTVIGVVASPQGYYNLSAVSSTISTYQLKADPTGAQSTDKCGTFLINEKGDKTVSVPVGSTLGFADCWPR